MFPEFCDEFNKEGCFHDYTAKGKCYVVMSGDNVPSIFDYWGNQTHSGDPFTDNCVYYQSDYNRKCSDTQVDRKAYEEAFGPNSRCFAGTFVHNDYIPSMHSACENSAVLSF